MTITLAWLLLNGAYVVYAISALFNDILPMRIALLAASVLFVGYGIAAPVWSVTLWNIPVAVVHAIAIWRLIEARRAIDLDGESRAIHTLLFPNLSLMEFNSLWHCGDERVAEDGEVLIVQGEPVSHMSLIIEGEVDVNIDDEITLRLGHIRLIGELSTLRNSDATATVTAIDTVRLRSWPKPALDALAAEHPKIEVALLRVMAGEAARKLN